MCLASSETKGCYKERPPLIEANLLINVVITLKCPHFVG